MRYSTLAFGLILACGLPAAAQQQPDRSTEENRKRTADDVKVIYGKLKEVTKGSKVVVQLEQSPDRTFDLKDKDTSVNIAEGLAVGDHVKVSESKKNGRHHVEIARQTAGTDGERSRSQDSRRQK
jgi:hypothetical protein